MCVCVCVYMYKLFWLSASKNEWCKQTFFCMPTSYFLFPGPSWNDCSFCATHATTVSITGLSLSLWKKIFCFLFFILFLFFKNKKTQTLWLFFDWCDGQQYVVLSNKTTKRNPSLFLLTWYLSMLDKHSLFGFSLSFIIHHNNHSPLVWFFLSISPSRESFFFFLSSSFFFFPLHRWWCVRVCFFLSLCVCVCVIFSLL